MRHVLRNIFYAKSQSRSLCIYVQYFLYGISCATFCALSLRSYASELYILQQFCSTFRETLLCSIFVHNFLHVFVRHVLPNSFCATFSVQYFQCNFVCAIFSLQPSLQYSLQHSLQHFHKKFCKQLLDASMGTVFEKQLSMFYISASRVFFDFLH